MFSVELRYRARKIYRSVKQIVELVSNVLLFLASFLAIILVIYRFGFDMPADYSHEIYYTYRAIIRLFVVQATTSGKRILDRSVGITFSVCLDLVFQTF